MTTLSGYHGLTNSNAITGDWRNGEMYVAYGRSLAKDVAIGGAVYAVTYEAHTPVVLDTASRFLDVWMDCGASEEPASFPDQKELLFAWARDHGHDAVCIPASAFAGELGYEWVAGTFGEPQWIALEPGRAVLTPC